MLGEHFHHVEHQFTVKYVFTIYSYWRYYLNLLCAFCLDTNKRWCFCNCSVWWTTNMLSLYRQELLNKVLIACITWC